jgi:hypothetical protein
MQHAIRAIVVLCALVAAVRPAPAEARRVALVIGNSAYEHTRVLPNARNDARIIAALLGKMGFAVSEAGDLAYRPMREAIRAFGEAAQGADMAVVYYAGHGLEVAGENWLLPVSAALKRERDLEYEAVSLSSILAAVKEARRLRLVILDACRNNPLGERMELSAGTPRSVPRGLARIEPSGDILVAYSAKHGTIADDGPAGGNSPFAAALALNMGTRGLDVRIMLGKVRDDVRKATGGRQEPFTYGSVGGEIIALHAGDGAAIDPGLPRSQAPPPKAEVTIAIPPKIKPAAIPRIDPPNEPLPEGIPVSAEILHLVETHRFFAGPPPVRLSSIVVARSKSSPGGAVTHYNGKSDIRWLRSGVTNVNSVTQETVVQSGRKFPGTRREAEVVAANGLISLGSKSSFSSSSFSATETDTLLRIDNMQGFIFPVEVGNRFTYDAVFQQNQPSGTGRSLEERTVKTSCTVTEKHAAAKLHSNLTGMAYVQICDYDTRYKRSRHYRGNLGIFSGKLKSYFVEALGIWIGADEVGTKFTLKSFE